MTTWSKPYYGVSHLGELSDARRATVCDYGSFVELSLWFRGCGFSPHTKTFGAIAEAKVAGEAWVSLGTMPIAC